MNCFTLCLLCAISPMYHFPGLHVDEYNSYPGNRGKIDNLVAQMENKTDGTRSYRIARTTPDRLSYEKDIARRYGLDLEGILGQGQ